MKYLLIILSSFSVLVAQCQIDSCGFIYQSLFGPNQDCYVLPPSQPGGGGNPLCVTTPCNLIMDGGFEGQANWQLNFTCAETANNCWVDSDGDTTITFIWQVPGNCTFGLESISSDVINRFGNGFLGFISPSHPNDTWDGDIVGNNQYIHFVQVEGGLTIGGQCLANSHNYHETFAQAMAQPLDPNTEYVIEFQYSYNDGDINGQQIPGLAPIVDYFLDDGIGICAEVDAVILDGTFLPGANAANFIHTGQINNELNWEHVVQSFTTPMNSNYQSIYFNPATNNFQVLGNYTSISHYIDDICVTPVSSNPISAAISANTNCASDGITLVFEMNTDFSASIDQQIDLTLAFPDGNVFNIVGGDFDANGDLTLNAGTLDNNIQTFTVDLEFDGTQIAGQEYAIQLLIDPSSPSGCLCHPPSWSITATDAVVNVGTVTNLTCFQDNSGSIAVASSGGSGLYSFDWSGPNNYSSSLQNITGLAAGDYQLTTTDDAGCFTISTFTVTEPNAVSISVDVNDESCPDACDGSIDVTVVEGVSPFSFNWTDSGQNLIGTTEDIFNLCDDTYLLDVTDLNGCSLLDFPVEVGTQNLSCCVIDVTAIIIDESCPTLCDGSIDIDVQTNETITGFTWSGPNGFSSVAEDITGLCSGNYEVTIEFGPDCIEAFQFVVNAPAPDFQNMAPISVNTIWSGQDYIIEGDVIVLPGFQLTITNSSIIRFTPGSRLIIGAGASLNVTNSTLTSACDEFWGGVELVGNNNAPQIPTAQGNAFISNSEISNALIGIRCQASLNGNDIIDQAGGWARCSTTDFLNNVIDLSIHNYVYDFQANLNSFDQCLFEINSGFYDSDDPDNRVDLRDVSAVRFNNCIFQNLVPEFLDEQQLIAVSGHKASFTMTCSSENCPGDAKVTGFTRGVRQTATSTIPTLIDGVIFECFRGVYILHGKPSVVRNQFNGMPTGYPLQPIYTGAANEEEEQIGNAYGLYLDGCSAFRCEENLFDIDDYDVNVGLYVRDSGKFPNRVYLNIFQQLDVGALFLDRNRNTQDPFQGLQIDCNTFQQNTLDIRIHSTIQPAPISAGIGGIQGQLSESATNTFTQATTDLTDDDDIQSDVGDLFGNNNNLNLGHRYYYLLGEIILEEVFDEGTNFAFFISNQALTCESMLELVGGGWESMMSQSTADYELAESELAEIVDGGDTPGLTQEVIETDYSEALELYYSLMEKSPNLSEEVMIEAIQKEFDLPMILLKEILTSNPQAAKSGRIQEELDNRLIPLPEYMRQEIQDGMNWLSLKEELESQIVNAKMNYKYALLNQVFNVLTDTLNLQKMDSLQSLLNSETDPEWLYLLADYFALQSDWSGCWQVLFSVPELNELNEDATAEHNDLVYLYTLQESINMGLDTLTLAEEATLVAIYEESGAFAASKALAMLIESGSLSYTEPEGTLQLAPELRNSESRIEETEAQYCFTAYPNPAHAFVEFDVKGIPLTTKATIEIHDLTGKLLFSSSSITSNQPTLMDLEHLDPGTYVVTLKDQGQFICSQVLMVW